MEELQIPKGKEDITTEWIVEVTYSHLIPIEGSISVSEISSGAMSNLLRVKFQTDPGITESLLVKLLPTNPFFQSLSLEQECDKREIKTYSEVIPRISQVVPELRENFCTFYNGFFNGDVKIGDYSSVLVLEDLEPAGYKNIDPDSPNWMENMRKALKFIGEFHSFGVYIEKKHHKKISEIYPFRQKPSEANTQMVVNWGRAFAPKLEELLQRHKCSKEMISSYQNLNEKIEQVIIKSSEKGMENPGLMHGDFWTSNILVKESDLDAPIKVIDFQFFGYRDPTWEHISFLLTAFPKDQLNRENVTLALRLYLKYFRDSCQTLGVEYEGRGENEFLHFFDTWGMAFGYWRWLLSIDSFENDEERLVKIFEMMEKEYKIVEFLLNNL